jgi:hypothetical protein
MQKVKKIKERKVKMLVNDRSGIGFKGIVLKDCPTIKDARAAIATVSKVHFNYKKTPKGYTATFPRNQAKTLVESNETVPAAASRMEATVARLLQIEKEHKFELTGKHTKAIFEVLQ